MVTRMRHLQWTAVLAWAGVTVGLLGGLLVVSSALVGCGQQNIQGCSPPGITPQPPAVSATNVGSVGLGQGGGATVSPSTTITVTFNQPMDSSTLKGRSDLSEPSKATILVERCGQDQQQCSGSTAVNGKVVTYDACSATATFVPDQTLTPGTQHVLGIPICTSPDALCSTQQSLARDTSGRPLTTGAGGLCGSMTNVVCVTFTTSGGLF